MHAWAGWIEGIHELDGLDAWVGWIRCVYAGIDGCVHTRIEWMNTYVNWMDAFIEKMDAYMD